MTPEQRARLGDAARYPMLAKMEDIAAALAHIDALEARVAALEEVRDDLDQKLTKYELQDAVRYAQVEKEKEALVARVKELEAREGR